MLDRLAAAMAGQDAFLRLALRIADAQADEEAIELALRQRIGALELVRVLRGQHEERRTQRPGLAVHRHLMIAHRLQQRSSGFAAWLG